MIEYFVHALKTRFEVAMGVLIFAMDTGLDALEPFILKDALDRYPSLRIGVQDLLHQRPGSKGQLLKGLVVVHSAHIQKVLVIGILRGGGSEGNTLVDHTIIHDAAGPDVDSAGIILFALELFGSNVRF